MQQLDKLDKNDLSNLLKKYEERYSNFKNMNLKLDMSRGKPASDQLDISMKLLTNINEPSDCYSEKGVDYRNYGLLDGIPELKKLFSQIMGVGENELIIGGNSSLNMMYDTVVRMMLFGNQDGDMPWSKLDKVKFLCPSPGYDRHFAICEQLGIEMIVIDMNSDGPDINKIEELVSSDASVRGMWCVPKYSNPDGITYSDEICRRLAAMKTAAPDFRIMWDNAYAVHHLLGKEDKLLNIMEECRKNGTQNRIITFASTSKVTFPGAGVAAMGSSEENIIYFKKLMAIQTIGPDKVNQLRHYKMFPDFETLELHMNNLAKLLTPKFDAVKEILERELSGTGAATWTNPNGGYFISFNSLDGCAKEIVAMAKEAGVTITPAGASYPYGKDPRDRNIRIAPTYPTLSELKCAIEVLCVCVMIVSIKKMIDKL